MVYETVGSAISLHRVGWHFLFTFSDILAACII